jgi:hypothetical protein
MSARYELPAEIVEAARQSWRETAANYEIAVEELTARGLPEYVIAAVIAENVKLNGLMAIDKSKEK